LRRHPELPVRVFVVWQPILPTDWAPPTAFAMNRISDRRAQQYWDPDHVVAKRLAADRRAPQPAEDCCERSGVLWDLVALYPKGAAWEERIPTATVFNGPVVDVTPEVESALAGTAAITSTPHKTVGTVPVLYAASSGMPRICRIFRGITFALPEACYVFPVERSSLLPQR
jgi:hypothetical protein